MPEKAVKINQNQGALKAQEKNHPVISVLGSISQKVPEKAVKINQNQGSAEGMGEKSPSYFCFIEYSTKSTREGCQNQSKSGSAEGMGENRPVISVLGSISQKVPEKAVKINQNQGALKAREKITQLFLF